MRSNQTVVDTQAINTSTGSTITIAADKTLVVNNLSGNGSDIVVTDTFNMSGESVLCNLVMTNYLSSLSDEIIANQNIQIDDAKYLQTDMIKSTTAAGTITANDHMKVNNSKTLYASTIMHAGADPTDFVDVTYKLKTPWMRTDQIEPLTNGVPINIAGSAKISAAHSLQVNTINPVTGYDQITTGKILASDLTLQNNGSLVVDMSGTQSIKLLNPTTSTSTDLSAVYYDPSDNKIKVSSTDLNPKSLRSLVEYFTLSKLEVTPYTTITMPTLPSELTNAIRTLVPDEYEYALDVIPGFSPTEETTYQNGLIYADSGLFRVKGTDLDKIVAVNTVPKDMTTGSGLVLSIDDVPTYDISYAIHKPFYMSTDAGGFRCEFSYGIVNVADGRTIFGLVSTDTVSQIAFKHNGINTVNYFADSFFWVHDPVFYGDNYLHLVINKTIAPLSYSQQTFNIPITIVSGRLINIVAEWNATIGKLRFTVVHGVATYDSDTYVSAANMPAVQQYAPIITQTRLSGTVKSLWLNKIICTQYTV